MKIGREQINAVFHGPIHVRIGRDGLKEGVLKEIAYQLDQLDIIKMKILGTDSKEDFLKLVDELEEKEIIKLLSVRGRTLVCARGKKYKHYL